MPSTIEQYIKLRDCIFMYSEAAKQDDTKFKRLWTMAFRGFIQMGYSAFWQSVTVNLPVNDNRTVTLPDDYIVWTKVGQMIGNEILLLKNNQSLLTATSGYEGVGDVVNSTNWFSGHSHFGCSCYKGNIEFKIVDGAILLGSDFEGDSLLLEYVGSPEQDDDYTIPIQFTEAMIDWLAWQDVKHIPASSHFGRGDKNDRALQFRASLKKAKKDYRPFRYSQILGGQFSFNQPQPYSAEIVPVTNTPLSLSITSNKTSVMLDWIGVDGAVDYNEEFANSDGTVRTTTFSTGTSGGTGTSRISLTEDTLYFVRITPTNSAGDEISSKSSGWVPFRTTYSVPVTVIPGQTVADLTWPTIPGAVSYKVYVYLLSDGSQFIFVFAGSERTYHASGLTPATGYSCVILPVASDRDMNEYVSEFTNFTTTP